MIRKLKDGKYRLYSRKKDERPAGDAISAPSIPARPPRGTNARCSISSAIEAALMAVLCFATRSENERRLGHVSERKSWDRLHTEEGIP